MSRQNYNTKRNGNARERRATNRPEILKKARLVGIGNDEPSLQRLDRATRLAVRELCIKDDTEHFLVNSQRNMGHVYIVTINHRNRHAECPCEDKHRFNGNRKRCKHIIAAKLFEYQRDWQEPEAKLQIAQ